jgi:catechol 2,3-dioxygenase-like lactoylglutathione lyase family enzyme
MELFAGMPVSDLERARRFYTRLLGQEPSFLPNDQEAVWTLADGQRTSTWSRTTREPAAGT